MNQLAGLQSSRDDDRNGVSKREVAPTLATNECQAVTAFSLDASVKCVVWDLDDTLWDGSLAENDEIASRPCVIEIVRKLNERGIVNSICSKNSYASAKKVLQKLGIWDYFVFPVIDFVPKGQSVRKIIDNLQLRTGNALFVDDNIGNRSEVQYYCEGVMVADPNDPQFLTLMSQIIEHTHGRSRLDQYRILEHKHSDKRQYANNASFLAASDITMCILRNPADMMFRERIFDLANRSNQLNFTKSKWRNFEELNTYLTDQGSVQIEHGVVFVYDKYGDYGLVGFYGFNEYTRRPKLDHFFFSCRVLNMGIEGALYSFLRKGNHIGRFRPIERRMNGETGNIRIIQELDNRLRSYFETETSRPKCFRTCVIAGCTSGIFDHYLPDALRPTLFESSVLSTYAKELPQTACIILTVYSDYLNKPWRESGGFSYERFQSNLAGFLVKHQDKRLYLLLASEKEFVSTQSKKFAGIITKLRRLRSSVMNGANSARYRRCNRLVREAVKRYCNVALIETGDFVVAEEEQHDARHFDRLVIKRICDHISELESSRQNSAANKALVHRHDK